MKPSKRMLGDKAYDSAELREELDERGTKPVIPNRCNRKQPFSFSKRLYKLRWRIESAFNRLKDFRRIATRYDRLARNYLASVCLAAALGLAQEGASDLCRRGDLVSQSAERPNTRVGHSITSSARATSSGGRSSPSARAVLRLMARSNFVGSSTGRSRAWRLAGCDARNGRRAGTGQARSHRRP